MTKYRFVYCIPIYHIISGTDKDWSVPAVIYHDKDKSHVPPNSCFQMFFAPNSWYLCE